MNTLTSFDKRNVRYEQIHNIQDEDFAKLVEIADVRDCSRVLDLGCGYGAVTREILTRTQAVRERNGHFLGIDLVDESHVQLARAEKELGQWLNDPHVKLNFIHGTFPDAFKGTQRYDVVAAKMVLHEVARENQADFIRGSYEYLKDGGRFLLWDLCLTPTTRDLFSQIMRVKDGLVGLDTMVARRNFLSLPDIIALLEMCPFTFIDRVKAIEYRLQTQARLIPEFREDQRLFDLWHEFIRQSVARLEPSIREEIAYLDEGHSIALTVRKGIFVARRSEKVSLFMQPFNSQIDLSKYKESAKSYPHLLKESLIRPGLASALTGHQGLIRASVLTRAYDGKRQLCKEGLDYFYHVSAQEAKDQHAYAYTSYIIWLYCANREWVGSRAIRSVSDAVSNAFKSSPSGGWLIVQAIKGDGGTKVIMGGPNRINEEAAVQVPRRAREFFDCTEDMLRSTIRFKYEQLDGMPIERILVDDNSSIDSFAQRKAKEPGSICRASLVRTSPEMITADLRVCEAQSSPLRSFLRSSSEVLVPLTEYLLRSGAQTAYYILPPSLAAGRPGSEISRIEDGVVVLTADYPLTCDAFENVLAYVVGLWSGVGCIESIAVGEAAEAKARSEAIAGFSHQVGHVIGAKSNLPLYDFMLERDYAGLIDKEKRARSAQIHYSTLLAQVYEDLLDRPDNVVQRWIQLDRQQAMVSMDALFREVWDELAFPILDCIKDAPGITKFGCRHMPISLKGRDEIPRFLVPGLGIVRMALFEMIWNAFEHGSFVGTAEVTVNTKVGCNLVEISVTNPHKGFSSAARGRGEGLHHVSEFTLGMAQVGKMAPLGSDIRYLKEAWFDSRYDDVTHLWISKFVIGGEPFAEYATPDT